MRDDLERNLASKIDPRVVADILNAYEGLIQKHRALDAEAALTRAGKFVEHVFRALVQSPSMVTSLKDLELRRLLVVHPGSKEHKLRPKIEVMSLAEFAAEMA